MSHMYLSFSSAPSVQHYGYGHAQYGSVRYGSTYKTRYGHKVQSRGGVKVANTSAPAAPVVAASPAVAEAHA